MTAPNAPSERDPRSPEHIAVQSTTVHGRDDEWLTCPCRSCEQWREHSAQNRAEHEAQLAERERNRGRQEGQPAPYAITYKDAGGGTVHLADCPVLAMAHSWFATEAAAIATLESWTAATGVVCTRCAPNLIYTPRPALVRPRRSGLGWPVLRDERSQPRIPAGACR